MSAILNLLHPVPSNHPPDNRWCFAGVHHAENNFWGLELCPFFQFSVEVSSLPREIHCIPGGGEGRVRGIGGGRFHAFCPSPNLRSPSTVWGHFAEKQSLKPTFEPLTVSRKDNFSEYGVEHNESFSECLKRQYYFSTAHPESWSFGLSCTINDSLAFHNPMIS